MAMKTELINSYHRSEDFQSAAIEFESHVANPKEMASLGIHLASNDR